MPTVYFAHGKESGPWGSKIVALATIAKARGFEVVNPEYSDILDPDERVKRLLALYVPSNGPTVLVGSSMGAYVSTVASSVIRPAGLFLMAPAFYLRGYAVQDPVPTSPRAMIVHGWNDMVVPVENSIQFAHKFHCELHVVDSDHRLTDQVPMMERLFAMLLDDVLTTQPAVS